MMDPEFSDAAAKKPKGPQFHWVNVIKGFLIAHCVALAMTASIRLYPRYWALTGFPRPENLEPYPLMMASVLGFEVGVFVLTPATLIAVLAASRVPDRASFRRGELPAVVVASLGLCALECFAIIPLVQ